MKAENTEKQADPKEMALKSIHQQWNGGEHRLAGARASELIYGSGNKLDEKLFRATMNAGAVGDNRNIQVSVLDPAYLPVRPISKPRSTMLAVMLGIVLALAIASMVVSALIDDRIYGRVDLERLDVLPVIAVIPRSRPELPAKSTKTPS